MSAIDLSQGVAAYIAAAGGRLEWLPWGKAQPDDEFVSPAHPLLCHVVDVASVAELLLQEMLPRSTRARLLDPLNLETDAAERWLVFIVAFHDLGKATPPFQGKWPHLVAPMQQLGFDFKKSVSARSDHGALGVYLASEAFSAKGVEPQTALRLARAVASHHGTFVPDAEGDRAPSAAERGGTRWTEARARIVEALAALFELDASGIPNVGADWGFYTALAGFTALADWVGSMAEIFRYEVPTSSLAAYQACSRARAREALERAGFRAVRPPLARDFVSLFGFPPRPLQQAIATLIDNVTPPFCVIVEAPMGDGKTEAALYAAHALAAHGVHDGAYVALPTQATANQMFDRLSQFLEGSRPEERLNLQLVHGEAVFDARVRQLLRAVYGEGDTPGLVCEPWFLSKKRALLAPFAAGTVDQALLGVLRTKHAFVRQFGLVGKTVILDEVHAYDTYTSTLLDRLVAWLSAGGASIVLLSATLTAKRRAELLRAYSPGVPNARELAAYPRLSWVTRDAAGVVALEAGRAMMQVEIDWLPDILEVRIAAVREFVADGGVVGVLCNTVRRAQELYAELRSLRTANALPPGTQLLLLHARFPAADRRCLELELVRRIGRDGSGRPERLIVVGTQVLEQSLDIDFDVLFTDAAPIDLLLQRAGRLHRHARPWRPEKAQTPKIFVVRPEDAPAVSDLSDVAPVYEPFLVRRSLLVLASRDVVHLPQDIEGLVEKVYADEFRADECGRLRTEHEEFERQRANEELLAMSRSWPPPTIGDDPFGDLALILEEDEDAPTAKMLKAETRLGSRSMQVVCLFGSRERAFLDRACTQPIDLDEAPTRDRVRALALRTVRVADPALVSELAAQKCPEKWSDVSILARRRPLFFGTGPVELGPVRVTLDEELGLVIERSGGCGVELLTDD